MKQIRYGIIVLLCEMISLETKVYNLLSTCFQIQITHKELFQKNFFRSDYVSFLTRLHFL